MSLRWCGCGNYEICDRCRNNSYGDPEKERLRRVAEEKQDRQREIWRLQEEINLLERRKKLMESNNR